MLTFVLAATLAAVLIGAGARYPNAIGSWSIAVMLVALPLAAAVASLPSGLEALLRLSSYVPYASDLLLALVGLSAIIVLDAAAARRHDRLQWAFWIGLAVSLATVSIALHWNAWLRASDMRGLASADIALVLSYAGCLLVVSFFLRLATAKD